MYKICVSDVGMEDKVAKHNMIICWHVGYTVQKKNYIYLANCCIPTSTPTIIFHIGTVHIITVLIKMVSKTNAFVPLPTVATYLSRQFLFLQANLPLLLRFRSVLGASCAFGSLPSRHGENKVDL